MIPFSLSEDQQMMINLVKQFAADEKRKCPTPDCHPHASLRTGLLPSARDLRAASRWRGRIDFRGEKHD